MSTRIEIMIDELVLHGFSSAERYAIGDALSQELQQLITAGNSTELASLGNIPFLRTNNITLNEGAKSAAVGSQVANAVYGGLKK